MAQILGTIFLALITWMAFRSLRAFTEKTAARVKNAGARRERATKQDQGKPVESMRECPTCKTFRPLSRSTACGRSDCPYGS